MQAFHWFLLIANIVISGTAAGHALATKKNPASALGWIAVCLFFPVFGPFFYFLFGINRVQTRAKKLEDKKPSIYLSPATIPGIRPPAKNIGEYFSQTAIDIAKVSSAVTILPMLPGNSIKMLENGDEAYPEMLESIANAKKRVYLSTYIFDMDRAGYMFANALSEAVSRGVDVKVIVDGIGEYYSIPRAGTILAKKGIKTARFLPPRIIPPAIHLNLRNHRKILITDGITAYTGGMNIRERHILAKSKKQKAISDIHFKLTGPVVSQLEQAFIEDWAFATGEILRIGSAPFPASGHSTCRTIIDGPNISVDKLALILTAAISSARKRVILMTPYFLPSQELISAMQTASLKGVRIDILLPEKNNLPLVHWAMHKNLGELMIWGINIFLQPPPFVHAKLILIDSVYAQIGSANIDPRSLRLNFELMVEVYDTSFASSMEAHVDERIKKARRLTMDDLKKRPWPAKARDSLAWLLSPYL